MKGRILLILLAILIPVIVVLMRVQKTKDLVHGRHGFYRQFISDSTLILKRIIPFPNLTRICGFRQQLIYFETKKIGQLVELNLANMQVNEIQLPFDREGLAINRWEYHIDSSGSFLLAGNLPAVFVSGMKDSFDFKNKIKLPGIAVRATVLSGNSLFIKGFDTAVPELDPFLYIISKEGIILRKKSSVFAGNDLGMQSDGQLGNADHYIVQTCFYENRFMRVDTTLSLVQWYETIEGRYQLNNFISSFVSDSSRLITRSAPEELLHPHSAVIGDLLFLQSRVKSDGESVSEFLNHTVIDLYRLEDGRYQGSFYLPKINGAFIKGFARVDSYLVGFTSESVAVFRWTGKEVNELQ